MKQQNIIDIFFAYTCDNSSLSSNKNAIKIGSLLSEVKQNKQTVRLEGKSAKIGFIPGK